MSAEATTADVRLRAPKRTDGAALHALVEQSTLETNSLYAYLLLATHFRDTGIVAEQDGALVGFVGGYRIPGRDDTLFVWQVGVAASARRTGLGRRMLLALAERLAPEGVRCIEATVGAGNDASARLFASVARELGTTVDRSTGFTRADFGSEVHEDEILTRVGPWELRS